MPRNSGSAANVHSAPLSPPHQTWGHKHHSLLPSVIEELSQRSRDVFTPAADLCGGEHAMSRRTVSNLNTTLQWSWLWPMYGASVYPAPISLTGPRRSRAGSGWSELGQRLTGDERSLNHPRTRTEDSGKGLNGASYTRRYLKYHFVFQRLHLSSSLVTMEE